MEEKAKRAAERKEKERRKVEKEERVWKGKMEEKGRSIGGGSEKVRREEIKKMEDKYRKVENA
jgi:hypothetical protein